MGLEGLVSKDGGRACIPPAACSHWIKVKNPAHPAMGDEIGSSDRFGETMSEHELIGERLTRKPEFTPSDVTDGMHGGGYGIRIRSLGLLRLRSPHQL